MLVAFSDYAAVMLKRIFPPIASRRELLDFMGGNPEANLLWTKYIIWHCGLNPARRAVTFRAWLKRLKREECTNDEWSLIADIRRDRDFPCGRLDRMVEYLSEHDAPDSAFDNLETLYIKYNFYLGVS